MVRLMVDGDFNGGYLRLVGPPPTPVILVPPDYTASFNIVILSDWWFSGNLLDKGCERAFAQKMKPSSLCR
jgi:hypothetical protein